MQHFGKARQTIIVLAALVLAGCAGEVGQTQISTIDIPRPEDRSQVWTVELNLGAASVEVGPNAEGLVQGTIEYNVDSLKPTVALSDRRAQIGQDFTGVLPVNTRNDWKLQLGKGVPIDLIVNTGASGGEWDLGGLSLRELQWTQGAAGATLSFSQPNPVSLDNFSFNGGAASVTVRGLANANIRTANITAGAGAVTLVFNGQLAQDADIILDGGVSSVAIYSGGNPIQLTSEGALKTIDNQGWTKAGDTYTSPEWTSAGGPKITIRSRLGVAALQLVAGQ